LVGFFSQLDNDFELQFFAEKVLAIKLPAVLGMAEVGLGTWGVDATA
jgi:hypothetical protein